MSRLFFARYFALSGLPTNTPELKLDFLLDGTTNDGSVELRGFVYRFLETQVFTWQQQDFVTGHLVKYRRDDLEKVVDEAAREIVLENLKNKLEAESRFIIDPSSGIMMFIAFPKKITKTIFMSKFPELFVKNHGNFFVEFHLESIIDRYSFVERVKKFKALSKITINLTPSNPHSPDLWKPFDDWMVAHNIDGYTEIQQNKSDVSGIIIDGATERKFLMAEDGYGRSTATGVDENGEKNTISTRDSEQDAHEDLPPDTVDDPRSIMDMVKEKLLEIKERTMK